MLLKVSRFPKSLRCAFSPFSPLLPPFGYSEMVDQGYGSSHCVTADTASVERKPSSAAEARIKGAERSWGLADVSGARCLKFGNPAPLELSLPILLSPSTLLLYTSRKVVDSSADRQS